MNKNKEVYYELFPKPQMIHYENKFFELKENINIIIMSKPKVFTLQKLENFLKGKNFKINTSDEIIKGYTNIILKNQEIGKTEGYTLKIKEDIIEITGNDLEGIYYGVTTFLDILKQTEKNILAECEITDYPEIRYRGYIEGFYGYPWKKEERIDLMEFAGDLKMNTYIYAPKDDPYHRKNWRELYPDLEAEEISTLAEKGNINNVNFVWTIHPGDTIDLSSNEDFNSAIKKLKQIYDLGVRQFGVLFDDIGGIPNGKQQADFINRIDREFIKPKGDIKPLITVGTRYCEAWGPSMEGYFKDFVNTLYEDIEIMWTGSATMSNISWEQFDAPKRKINTKKNLSVWWNYPVNDYCDQKILMGKIKNLDSNLNNVNGFFSNPMKQAQASKQALFCIANHNWSTHLFDIEKVFTQSFKHIAPEVSDELEIFASNSCYLKDDGGVSGEFLFDESWYLKEDIKLLSENLKKGNLIEPYDDRLYNEFINIENCVDKIIKDCKNINLIEELRPFLNSLKLVGNAGKHIILAIKDLKNNNITGMEKNNNIACENLKETEFCKVNRLKDGVARDFTVDAGTLVIRPFIKEMLDLTAILAKTESKPLELNYKMNNIALSSLGVTVSISSGNYEEEKPENIIKGKISGGKWCSKEYRPYITLDLKEIKTIKQYRLINCGHKEAGETNLWNTKEAQILASLDGENFHIIDEIKNNKEDIVNRMLFNEVKARYIRLQILEPAQISINGGGHTRIYSFELFEDGYPHQSDKILPSEIEIISKTKLTIANIKKGDIINLYNDLDKKEPIFTIEEVKEDMDFIIIESDNFIKENRLYFERISKNYLPSVKTSKATYI